MTRSLIVGLAVVPLLVGCPESRKLNLVAPGDFTPSGAVPRGAPKLTASKATEETAVRVATLGRKIIEANEGVGVRPTFACIGAPQPAAFHKLTRDSCEIYVSEGLVKQCKSEGQLAAVLCTELGRVVAEKAALVGPAVVRPDIEPPFYTPVGRDEGGAFGGPDGTRMMELAAYEKRRDKFTMTMPTPPPPDVLARSYLQRAGFPASDLVAAAPVLRATEQDPSLEQQMVPRR